MILWFQSTLPRGERLQIFTQKTRSREFQSTLPRGERLISASTHSSTVQFQSTLPRGERRGVHRHSLNRYVFQSTLPRGERHSDCCFVIGVIGFNPRSHEGSDIAVILSPTYIAVSIHAPTRGATAISPKNPLYFQLKLTIFSFL